MMRLTLTISERLMRRKTAGSSLAARDSRLARMHAERPAVTCVLLDHGVHGLNIDGKSTSPALQLPLRKQQLLRAVDPLAGGKDAADGELTTARPLRALSHPGQQGQQGQPRQHRRLPAA